MSFLNTDIPELSGFDSGLCLANLELLCLRLNRGKESVLAVLTELADALIQDAAEDPETVDSILLSLQSPPDSEVDEDTTVDRILSAVVPVNREDVCRMSVHSGLYARLLLYRLIEERMPTILPTEEPSRPSPLSASMRDRVAYMPAPLADKAYLRLTTSLRAPRADSTASFVDACEEVHSGLAEYCILPLEDAHSGRLTAFVRLMLRYRLQIVAICDLESGANEGQATRFALLREGEEGRFPTSLVRAESSSPLLLELIHLTDSPSLTDLLLAAEFCGMHPLRVDTLPSFDELEIFSEETPSATAFSCVLNVEGGDLITFRRFLSLEAPEDILTGLYRQI